MRGITGLLGVVVVLGTAYFLYHAQLNRTGTAAGMGSPHQQIDVTAIRSSLLEIGQAQRMYVNAHGAYGTLDQLRADGPPHLGAEQRGYVYRVEPNGAQGFRASATPADPGKNTWPTLTIDETMQIATR